MNNIYAKERPILFSAPMVRAILAGRKTQTRRVANKPIWTMPDEIPMPTAPHRYGAVSTFKPCPYGQPGDRLWVRETFTTTQHGMPVYRADARDKTGARWNSIEPGDPQGEVLWKPSIFMPRAFSRITLEITGVRVERLQDITEADAIAEGIERMGCDWMSYGKIADSQCDVDRYLYARDSYRSLWSSINGPGSWEVNPFVWVVEFRRVS